MALLGDVSHTTRHGVCWVRQIRHHIPCPEDNLRERIVSYSHLSVLCRWNGWQPSLCPHYAAELHLPDRYGASKAAENCEACHG